MQPASFAKPALDYLQCQYRSDLQVLVGRWMRQPTEVELREGYFSLLETAETYQACFWLVDARRRAHANQQSTPWMVETFFPLLPQHLGAPVFIAYLFMPNHLQEIEQDVAIPALSYFDNRPYQVQRFTDEQAAMDWLRVNRAVSAAS